MSMLSQKILVLNQSNRMFQWILISILNRILLRPLFRRRIIIGALIFKVFIYNFYIEVSMQCGTSVSLKHVQRKWCVLTLNEAS